MQDFVHFAKALKLVHDSLEQPPQQEEPMTTAYTNGPWKVRQVNGYDARLLGIPRYLVIQAGSGSRIAGMLEGWPDKDAEANARLIAAAPALLEAAKAAHLDLGRWQDNGAWDDEDDVVMIQLIEAIAQAEGKE